MRWFKVTKTDKNSTDGVGSRKDTEVYTKEDEKLYLTETVSTTKQIPGWL